MSTGYGTNVDIFEHGILVENEPRPPGLALLATTRLPVFSGFSVAIVDSSGTSLNGRAVRLATIQSAHFTADYYDEYDLGYCLLLTLYHLNRLVDLYVTACQLFESHHSAGTALRGNTDDPRVSYEVDAFLGGARRVYESVRKVLWKHYSERGSRHRWRSIKTVVRSPVGIPPLFATELQDSWHHVGQRLADYRDCVIHNDPLTDGLTTCWLERYADRWGVTVKLPSNPEKKGRASFDFAAGPDALAYCHSVACHLVGLCESLLAQSRIADYLSHPPSHDQR